MSRCGFPLSDSKNVTTTPFLYFKRPNVIKIRVFVIYNSSCLKTLSNPMMIFCFNLIVFETKMRLMSLLVATEVLFNQKYMIWCLDKNYDSFGIRNVRLVTTPDAGSNSIHALILVHYMAKTSFEPKNHYIWWATSRQNYCIRCIKYC